VNRLNGVGALVDLLKKIVAVAIIAAIGYFGEKGAYGGFVKDVWSALKSASPPVAMVMFMLFLDERRERRECQKQLNERTVDFIQSTNAADSIFAKALDRLSMIGARKRR
jgi:hypothetical protein